MSALPDPASPLSAAQADAAFAIILDGGAQDDEIADFLIRLSDRGETADEIAAAARAMRARMIAIEAPDNAIDVCGTGGDGLHTVNVSTAVAIVVAAAGVPVAKHGNRAASSLAGAADTLEALGLDLVRAAHVAERSLAELNICFLFAQAHHPALARLGPIRRAIGRRTIFNLLGPIANPAKVTRQLVGIARGDYIRPYAEAMGLIGMTRAMIVSGADGMDELTLSAPNHIAQLVGPSLRLEIVSATDIGLTSWPNEALRGGDAARNAAALRGLLAGDKGAYREAVLFNAAAALMVAGASRDWQDGIARAAALIDDGRANHLLDRWIAYS